MISVVRWSRIACAGPRYRYFFVMASVSVSRVCVLLLLWIAVNAGSEERSRAATTSADGPIVSGIWRCKGEQSGLLVTTRWNQNVVVGMSGGRSWKVLGQVHVATTGR